MDSLSDSARCPKSIFDERPRWSRDPDWNKPGRGIEVVLTGLINHSCVSELTSLHVPEHLTGFACNEVEVGSPHTQRKTSLRCGFGPLHFRAAV